jgi:hypothetical protein
MLILSRVAIDANRYFTLALLILTYKKGRIRALYATQ